MKIKNIIINAVFLVAIAVVIFSPGIRRESLAIVQRGVLELGLHSHGKKAHEQELDPSIMAKRLQGLRLKNQKGESLQLSELRGKVVFMNFWATWCAPCIAEMPSINKFYQKYKEDDAVVFLMVSKDQNFEKAKAFRKRKGFDFDIHHIEGRAPKQFRPTSIPTTYILDKNGEPYFTQTGMEDYTDPLFQELIAKLKKQPE